MRHRNCPDPVPTPEVEALRKRTRAVQKRDVSYLPCLNGDVTGGDLRGASVLMGGASGPFNCAKSDIFSLLRMHFRTGPKSASAARLSGVNDEANRGTVCGRLGYGCGC